MPRGSGPASEARTTPGPPILFVQNVGQFARGARFQARMGDVTLWVTDHALWVTSVDEHSGPPAGRGTPSGVNLRLSFPGANPGSRPEPLDRLSTHVSYFHGSDPARWRADVPVWSGVRFRDLYPGIDLEWGGLRDAEPPRMIVRPGADLGAVRLRVQGAWSVQAEGGGLRLRTEAGDRVLPLFRPVSATGSPIDPPTPALAVGNTITAPFASGSGTSPDRSSGPEDLVYSTFLGGGRDDLGQGVAVDATGAVYITGFTLSTDLPVTPGAFQSKCGSCSAGVYDSFVSKLSPDGSALVYSTFLGGSDYDCFYSYAGDSCTIAVDGNGDAYVGGFTESPDFPTTPGAFDRSCNSCEGYFLDDAFVSKLNQTGTALVYSTFIGGSSNDEAHGIALDASGAAYLTGRTASADFPVTPGAFQQTNRLGGYDSFVTKLGPNGGRLIYSTFLGGEDDDCHVFGSPYTSCGIAVDGSGYAYVTGSTQSYEFPVTPGAFQPSCHSQCFFYGDAYVTKLNRAGSGLVYSTYLGGEVEDYGAAIEVGRRGVAYLIGSTQSSDFPTTPGVFQPGFAGESNAFITALSRNGSRLVWSTYLGGPHDPRCATCGDYGYDLAVAASGAVAVTGYTGSFFFPVTADAYQRQCAGPPVMCGDVFVDVLSRNGSALLYGTYLGGGSQDQGDGIAMDAGGGVYVTGYTGSAEFPVTPGAFQPTFGGFTDAFVAKLALGRQLRPGDGGIAR